MVAIHTDPTALLNRVSEYLPPDKVAFVEKAYQFAEQCHRDQRRLSGDPFIVHPLAAALTVAELQLEAAAVAAALLHDVQEDCGIANAELQRRFGEEVARLVEGASKLSRLSWVRPDGHRAEEDSSHAENLRKMFLAMAEDLRVLIIKLADRLHNMQTLQHLPADDQRRIAQETMDIYAPLASRLGIWHIKWQLEDLGFRYLQPERYREVAQLLASRRVTRDRYIRRVEQILQAELAKHGIEADVQGRAKHLYSIHQKMERYALQGKSFDEIYDLLALRVLVGSVADCYNALGVVHGLWKPMPGQFDDYIANPKGRVYQSLHSTVMCLDAQPLEVQIRTHEMHQAAEYGVAAHWRYKEGMPRDAGYEERLAWLRQLLEWHREMAEAEAAEFVESVKTDIFPDQVFVFTPKGDIKNLPLGATPVDFAYRIHTDVGNRCVGAKVNGRLVPLNHQLQNGDVVEIMTSRSARGPSRDWLNTSLGYVHTSHGREKVRQWFKLQERGENIERGQESLERELRRLGTSWGERQQDILRLFAYEDAADFLAAVGYGGISTHQVALRLAPLLQPPEPEVPPGQVHAMPPAPASVRVLGTGDLLTHLALCCQPVPGDKIIGYVTRSRGVTVHNSSCHNMLNTDEPERLIDVEWGVQARLYPVAVQIEAWDRVGLLRDVATLVAAERVNMVGIRTQEHPDGSISIFATLETTGVEQLTRLFSKLDTLRGVHSVRRLDGSQRAG